MKILIALITLTSFTMISNSTLYDFSKTSSHEWKVVDDVVMGGRSSGNFKMNSEDHGVFYGDVSTENNGGFSSIRHQMKSVNTSDYEKVVIKVKGDGKNYQFRVKPDQSNYYSFIYTFETKGGWEEIEIPFKELFPSFRGRKLDQPNFDGEQIEEITFLIANKRNEAFRLELDWIKLN